MTAGAVGRQELPDSSLQSVLSAVLEDSTRPTAGGDRSASCGRLDDGDQPRVAARSRARRPSGRRSGCSRSDFAACPRGFHRHRLGHQRLGRAGDLGQQLAHGVGAAAPPGGAVQHRHDAAFETLVGIGDDQLGAGQPSGHQTTEERRLPAPSSAVMTSTPRTSRWPAAFTPGGAHHRHVLHPVVLPYPLHQGVDRHVGVGRASRGRLRKELTMVSTVWPWPKPGTSTATRCRGCGRRVPPAGWHPLQVTMAGLHRHHRPLGPPAGLDQAGGSSSPRRSARRQAGRRCSRRA